MNPLLQSAYDMAPVRAQEALLSMFSARLGRKRYGGSFGQFQELLKQSQWWDREKMGSWQDQKLRAMVNHAFENVPYYRTLFMRHNIQPSQFRGREDLCKLPLLTREAVKRHRAELRSRTHSARSLVEGHTSGTTGSPLTVYFDREMVAMNYAVMDRQYKWLGGHLGAGGDRIAVLRGNTVVPLRQLRPPFWRHNRNLNQLLLSSFHLKESNIPAYVAAIRQFEPTVIDGYPSSLYVLGKFLLRLGQPIPLKAAVTSSETLYDFQRETIEQAFCCRVYDYYAAAERVIFSVECEAHSGHHLCEEYGVTEVVDEAGNQLPPGSEGFLVGTTLHNSGMPLLRYLTTDRCAIRPQPCTCGRPLPLVNDVMTKAEDLLKLKDGRLIPPSVLTHPFKPLDSIEASQIVQTECDHITVRLVPRPEYRPEHADHLLRELKVRLGQDMRIDIELLESLPRTAAGKFKWVISNVDSGL